MIKFSKEQIREIADNLDCGMKCYLNKDTGAITSILDPDNWQYYDEETWEEVINDLEENWDNYVEIPKMESRESYDLMTDYTETVNNDNLQNRLINALNRSHPFRNFKQIIDDSGPYRQQWFEFKNQRLIQWVKDKLGELNIKYDNE